MKKRTGVSGTLFCIECVKIKFKSVKEENALCVRC